MNQLFLLKEKKVYFYKKKYDFESLYRHIDKSSDKQFITSKNLNKLTKKTKTVEELDLTNVTEIDWKGENITYLIPFLGSKKYLILLVEENSAENIDFSKGTIVDHEVDSVTGSGTISIFTEEIILNKPLKMVL